jgi:hypothetical protein
MDKQTNELPIQKEPPKGITRRNFLKGIGAGVAYALAPKIPNLPAIPTETKEIVPLAKKEWKIEEVLLDPTELLNKVSDRIQQQPPEARTAFQISFLETFGPNQLAQERTNRPNLINGYKKYGSEILNLRKRLNDANIFPGSDIDWDQGSFSNLIRPFQSLIQIVDAPDNLNIDINPNDYSELISLSNWFQFALEGSYDEQKTKCINYSKYFVDLKGIEKNIQSEWDLILKAQSKGKIEGFRQRRIEGENLQIQINEVINNKLPLAFAKFKYDSLYERRGFYSEVEPGAKGVFVGGDNFLDGFNSWLIQKGTVRTSTPVENAQALFNQYLIDIFHELGHGVDPLFVLPDKDTFYMFHPEDYFNYLGEYVSMFEDIKDFMNGDSKKKIPAATANEIEGYCIDPLAIYTFGVDELSGPGKVASLKSELDSLYSLCSNLEHPLDKKKYQKAIYDKRKKLDQLFVKNDKGMLLTWENTFMHCSLDANKILIDNISKFNAISRNNIQELQSLVSKIFDDPNVDYKNPLTIEVGHIILNIKSMYMMASLSLLDNLATEKIIKNDGQNNLFPIYQRLAHLIYWEHAHAATGPMGDYLKMADEYQDTRITPDEELGNILAAAQMERKVLPYSILAKQYGPTVADSYRNLYAHITEIQKKRATMWGAKDPSLVYPEIANEVITNLLDLPLYYDNRSLG